MILDGVVEKEHLRCHGVDGVDDEVELLCHQVDNRLIFKILRKHVELYLRVDVADTFSHHVGLEATHGAVEREELTVFVGDAHGVAVDDSHLADASARQLLGGVGTYAAEPDDEDMRLGEPLNTFFTY